MVLRPVAFGLLAAALAVAAAVPALPPQAVLAVFVLSGAALVLRRGAPWALLGAGLALWVAADAAWTQLTAGGAVVTGFTHADALWLAYYVPTAAGVVLLCRSAARGSATGAALDAALAGFCALALSAAVVIEDVVRAAQGLDAATFAVNVAYPLLDVALLALAVGGLALAGWRADRRFALLCAGVLLFFAGDALYLSQAAAGVAAESATVDALFAWSAVVFGLAAWQPAPAPRTSRDVRASRRVALVPVVAGALALAVLLHEALTGATPLTLVPAAAALVAVLARLANALLAQRALVLRLSHEARTDALTGLGNRSLLRRRLAEVLAPEAPRRALVLVDLDGLRTYNDAFGQEAGDVLLQRIACALVLAAGPGAEAFRSGGDQFHLLLPADEQLERFAGTVARAAEQRGDGFRVNAGWGLVRLPGDAADPDAALSLADHRAHRRKAAGRQELPGVRGGELLHAMLEERSPETARHAVAVADVAVAVAERLGLGPEQREVVRQAALLHDVGKLGLPVEVLGKRGPLDEDEWRLVRKHTLIGERVLATSPGLDEVAAAVRSSHERWDGTGYPDRLAGSAIPLAARIVFVCDAFDAMTSDRPYRDARGDAEALAELRACAGTQFDPDVVEAFAGVLGARATATAHALAAAR